MNKSLFKTTKTVDYKTDLITTNHAGGKAYELSAEQALAQYAVTCCFGGTFYASAETQLNEVKALLEKVNPLLIAKMAVYSHQEGNLKDMPVFLLSYLFSKGETELVRKVFPKVITNAKMLCNFVQFVRSGTHGRKSFGSVGKELIQNWLTSRSAEQLFKDSVGHSNPSLTDIIKMVHPKFSKECDNVVKYLLGKDHNSSILPPLVQRFEGLKRGERVSPEGLDFRLLSNLKLDTAQWSELAKGMTWNALRMNLNNLQKHGVFNTDATPILAQKLSDSASVKRANAFPYQLLTTYQNTQGVPDLLKDALGKALEAATENVPNLGRVAVAVDVSGSMSHPATGLRVGSVSVTRCVDIAALVASCVLRTATEATVVPFDTRVHNVKVNKYNSVLTNAKVLSIKGGGTDCWCALKHLIDTNWKGDLVFMVSDNESWVSYNSPNAAIRFRQAWDTIKARNPKCKLVLLDVTPNRTSQMHEDKNVLHVGGFSDSVFDVVKNFVNGNGNFLSVIESVDL